MAETKSRSRMPPWPSATAIIPEHGSTAGVILEGSGTPWTSVPTLTIHQCHASLLQNKTKLIFDLV
jgi:hypothetical protein